MKNIAVLGAQVGDEAKGRVSNDFSINYDFLIRFAGGSNCGAKIIRNGKEYIHHLLPAIDYTQSKAKSFLASGMVISMDKLLTEILEMEKDFPGIVAKNIIVDPDAFVVLPEHIEQDKVNGKELGTTGQGIREAYTSKVARTGTRVYDLINDNAPIIKKLKDLGVQFIPLLAIRETMEKSRLLFEGNQGIMLDLNAGRYPYVTSSETGVSGIYSSGFHFVKLDKVYGVCKPYLTRSGGSEMPTEIYGEEAEILRKAGHEYGNTTLRARGVGHLDIPALKYACLKGGITNLIFTKMDILNGQEYIKVCYSYGKDVFSPNDFNNVEPRYIEVPGWNDAHNLDEIKPFISFVEKYVDRPVDYISCGVDKKDLLKLSA